MAGVWRDPSETLNDRTEDTLPDPDDTGSAIPGPQTRRPRVVHAIDSFTTGGAERLLLSFIENSGLTESRVIALSKKGTPFEEKAIGSRIPVSFLADSRIKSPATWISAYRSLKETPADVVHIHLQYSTLIFLPLARLLGLKSVVTLHSPNRNAESAGHRLRNRTELSLLRHWADCIIGVGPTVTAAWREKLPGREIRTVANAVPIPDLGACRPRSSVRGDLGTSESATVFACVASLTPQKNIGALLDAFAVARRDLPSAELWLVGDGALRGRLEQKAREMGLLSQGVRFLGVRSDIGDLLAASDIFVLSSKWEGLPVAMLEAMAHAVPVIVPDVGDVATVATAENAVLIEAENVDALGDALVGLARDPQRRRLLGEAARRTIQSEYGEAAWLAKLRGIYRDLAGPQPGHAKQD